jgi:hypothetical protein
MASVADVMAESGARRATPATLTAVRRRMRRTMLTGQLRRAA